MCGKFKIQNSSVRVLLKLLAFQSSPTLPKARSSLLLLYEIWKLFKFYIHFCSLEETEKEAVSMILTSSVPTMDVSIHGIVKKVLIDLAI